MKYIYLFILALIAVYAGYRVLSLDFSRLSEYGWGWFAGNLILLIVALALLVILSIRYFKKKS